MGGGGDGSRRSRWGADPLVLLHFREGYSRPIVVCDKCAGVQKPGGAESNAAQDWIADLRSVLSTLDGGQYLTWRAATQYRNRNYATLPQTCNAGTGCQQAIDAPACPGHRWPLWGVYTVKNLLEDDPTFADYEIRQTVRVYDLDGREVWRTKQIIMRRDAPRTRRWLLGGCQDGEWDDLEAQERERQAAATERRHRWERERQAWIDGLMQGEMEVSRKHLDPRGGQGQAVISVGMTKSDTVWPAFPATKSAAAAAAGAGAGPAPPADALDYWNRRLRRHGRGRP